MEHILVDVQTKEQIDSILKVCINTLCKNPTDENLLLIFSLRLLDSTLESCSKSIM